MIFIVFSRLSEGGDLLEEQRLGPYEVIFFDANSIRAVDGGEGWWTFELASRDAEGWWTVSGLEGIHFNELMMFCQQAASD